MNLTFEFNGKITIDDKSEITKTNPDELSEKIIKCLDGLSKAASSKYER